MGTHSHTIIPQGENNCVWMDAGLVNYKLCDRNFECEVCPFDTTMKTQHHAFAERATMQSEQDAVSKIHFDSSEKFFQDVISQLINPLKNISFPGDRLYLANHTWIKHIGNGQYKIGIDGFLAHFLKPLMGLVIVHAPTSIEKESPYAWLIRDNETYSLHSSFSGTVTEKNASLTSKPMTLINDPYEEGWIVILNSHNYKDETTKSYSAEHYYQRVSTDILKIESLLTATVTKQRKDIGTSLFDGGSRIESIEQFIGEKRYTQLLSRLLNPHLR